MTETLEIPQGFAPHFRKSPLTDPWEPLYSKKEDGTVLLGTHVRQPHVNGRGFAHGGFITALADNAMGLTLVERSGGLSSLVTVGLSIDFIGSAQIGQWLEVRPDFIKLGKSLGFMQCAVTADGKPCARANATFHTVPRT